jgi:hypothetical protein
VNTKEKTLPENLEYVEERHSGTRVTKRYYEFQTSSMKSAVDKVRKIR